MAFKERRSIADREQLELPIDGTVYTIPPPDAETALQVQELARAAAAAAGDETRALALSDEDERDMYPRLMGDAWDALIDDRVAWPDVQAVAITTMTWIIGGLDAAQRVWESGGDPESLTPPPNREQRRASRRASAASGTASTASTTRTKDSTSRPARRGGKSSTSGRS